MASLLCNFFYFSMTRKFRLSIKKRQYRPEESPVTELTISIPLGCISIRDVTPRPPPVQQPCPQLTVSLPLSYLPSIEFPELNISFPITYFYSVPSASLHDLRLRLAHLGFPSPQWCDTTLDSSATMTLCRIAPSNTADALPRVDFTLIVESNHSWKLFLYDQRLELDRCHVFANAPSIFQSPSDVFGVLSAIEGSAVCIGNPDEKFGPLVQRHHGQFFNPTGKLACTCSIFVSIQDHTSM